MASSQKQTLLTVLDLKNKAVDFALSTLNHIRQEFQFNKEKHEQLLVYRQDYMQQLTVMGEDGCNVGKVRNRIDFIHQLDSALSQMSQNLGLLAKKRTEAEKKYIAARQEAEALVKLIAKKEQIAIKQEDKKLQKEMDEHAMKQWYSSHKSQRNNIDSE